MERKQQYIHTSMHIHIVFFVFASLKEKKREKEATA